MKKDKIVYVEWVDSSSLRGVWHGVSEIIESGDVICRSVGYLVHEDDKALTIAAHKGTSDFAGEMRIPKGCIRKRKLIRGIT